MPSQSEESNDDIPKVSTIGDGLFSPDYKVNLPNLDSNLEVEIDMAFEDFERKKNLTFLEEYTIQNNASILTSEAPFPVITNYKPYNIKQYCTI